MHFSIVCKATHCVRTTKFHFFSRAAERENDCAKRVCGFVHKFRTSYSRNLYGRITNPTQKKNILLYIEVRNGDTEMFNAKRVLILASIAMFCGVPMAMADSFIDDRTGSADAAFQNSFDRFGDSMDNAGSTMSRNESYSSLSTAHKNLVNQQAIQTDTAKTSRDAFWNEQAQMTLSGGSYNSNGSYGYGMLMGLPYGNFGCNNGNSSTGNVTPDTWGSNMGATTVSRPSGSGNVNSQ